MGLGNYILDADGNPLEVDDVIAWAKWFHEADRHVQSDRIPVANGEVILVSTVFLGVDHAFGCGGPPVLWETMIFGGQYDLHQERYINKVAALAGHDRALAMVRDSL